jgi:hypothetical protein
MFLIRAGIVHIKETKRKKTNAKPGASIFVTQAECTSLVVTALKKFKSNKATCFKHVRTEDIYIRHSRGIISFNILNAKIKRQGRQ